MPGVSRAGALVTDSPKTRVWLLEVTPAGAKEPTVSRCVGDKALDAAMKGYERDPSNKIRARLA